MLHFLRLLVLSCCGAGFMPAISLADTSDSRTATTLAFELPAQTGIIEGIAFRASTGDFFFGDVHHRCIWRRDQPGDLTRFSPPGDVLYGVFGLVVDEARHLLWAATAMIPEAAGFTPTDKGRAALVALDLATGRIVQTHPVPPDHRDHVLGDLLLAPGGAIYVTDSLAPVIWRLSPGSRSLDSLVESPAFRSLQGLALVAENQQLLVSDYSHGLFTVDLATRAIRPLTAAPDTDLRGLDGLLLHGSELLAVSNAREPNRVLRLTLSPDATAIVAVDSVTAPPPGFNDLTLMALAGEHPCIVANSGWSLADPAHAPAIAPHPVRIFSLP